MALIACQNKTVARANAGMMDRARQPRSIHHKS